MAYRSTEGECAKRVNQVLEWYSLGYTRSQIQQFSYDAGWDVSETAIDDYIRKAKKIVAEHNEKSREELLGVIQQNQWELYRKTQAGHNPNPAISRLILMDVAKIRGLLDQKEPGEKEPINPDAQKLSDEELKAQLGRTEEGN